MLRDYIWQRQYALRPDETYEQGLQRVANFIGSIDTPSTAPQFRALMQEGKFMPGGRILAGVGTAHGQLQNCFVLDGKPYAEGTTSWVMALALRLAKVTKVGGGCGLNLDPLAPKGSPSPEAGQLHLYIDPHHPNAEDFYNGALTDPQTGRRVLRGYKAARPTRTLHPQAHPVDDSIHDIFSWAFEAASLLSQGEDVHLNLSNLRPENSPILGSGGTSSGPASFALEVFDNMAHWVNLGGALSAGPVAALRYIFAPTLRVIRQGGTRRGAGMATLSIDHPDWQDFLTCKELSREQEEGDISTYNISFLVPASFMLEAAQSGTPQEQVLRRIAHHAHATGEPGLLFQDTINFHNALEKLYGPIKASNPCGEIPLYPDEPCNLGALNLAAFAGQEDHLAPSAKLATRFLDNVLSLTHAPITSIQKAIENRRRIGLGIMGLADYLILKGLRYDSSEGRQVARNLMGVMTLAALEESEALGKEQGIPSHVQQAGLQRRNIALMTVAPTGTTSMLLGVSSGIEPVYAASYQRRIGTEYKELLHPLLETLLNEERALSWARNTRTPLFDGDWKLPTLLEGIRHAHGSIQPLVKRGWLPPWLDVFLTAHDIAPEDHVAMQAAVQQAMDVNYAGNAISKTINLPSHATEEQVFNAYLQAWELDCKGITVYRDGSRGFQVLSTGEGDFDTWAAQFAPHPTSALRIREPVINAQVHKYDIGGRKLYITIGWNQQQEPVEVWVNLARPTPNEAVSTDIIGRLCSLSLKYGASVQDLQKHLQGHFDQSGGLASGLGFVNSIWDVVAAVLSEYTPHSTPAPVLALPSAPTDHACPHCSSPMAREEGCWKCYSCGHSKCG
jgi:ribonucleoside-diphosphate reductase alpha chain